MRISVDARSFFMRTGIARYARAMLDELIASGGSHEWLLLISDRHAADEVPVRGRHVHVQVSSAPWLGGARERRQLDAEVTAWRADVFYSIFPPVTLENVPSVVTVFDCIAWSHPHVLPRRVVRAFRTASARALPRAHTVVAISAATAAQVRHWFPRRAGDVRVAPCGVSRELTPLVSVPPAADDRRGVLFVGTIEPRKNLPAIVRAARNLPNVPFTIVGKPGWGDYDLAGDIESLSNVTWLPRVDDAELARLYTTAAVLVYPSLVEGFGLPVLEAIAHRVLPIVSPDPALCELVSDDALIVDPDAPDALARAIDRWLAAPDARARRVEGLAAQTAQMTWANGARVVLEALGAAAASAPPVRPAS